MLCCICCVVLRCVPGGESMAVGFVEPPMPLPGRCTSRARKAEYRRVAWEYTVRRVSLITLMPFRVGPSFRVFTTRTALEAMFVLPLKVSCWPVFDERFCVVPAGV